MPFFAQTEFQCGPAALATILAAAGASVTPEALADAVYIAGLARQPAARAARRDAPARVHTVRSRAAAGRAVCRACGQAGPCSSCRISDSRAPGLALRRGRRSGSQRRSSDPALGHRTAPHGAHPTLPAQLAARRDPGRSSRSSPASVPATATAARYVRAVSGAETLLPRRRTRPIERRSSAWPQDELVLFAAAARKNDEGDLTAATALYRELLAAVARSTRPRATIWRMCSPSGLLRSGPRRSARGVRARYPSDELYGRDQRHGRRARARRRHADAAQCR